MSCINCRLNRYLALLLNTLLFTTVAVASTRVQLAKFSPFAYVGRNSTSNDQPTHIALSANGSIFIGGNTSPLIRTEQSDLQFPLSENLLRDDFFIAKVSSHTLDVQWVFRDGSSREDRLQAMLLDNSGVNLFAAGRTFGDIASVTNQGQADAFLIKYDVSGNRPIPVWEKPLILGTEASESITALVQDPTDNDLIYATGFTSGTLFPGHVPLSSGATDAFLFSFSAATGRVIHSLQFGTDFSDQGTDIVVSEDSDGPIFVSVVTERKIGQYAIGNFHLYKMSRNVTSLGDFLLKSFSREQVSAFRKHPMLPATLLVVGSSWLDERNGYDMFVKRVVRNFDTSHINSTESDIDEVEPFEYTKRVQSFDGSHDYSSGALVDPDSGVLLVSGYTGGKFEAEASDKGILAPFITAIDPVDASVISTVQVDLTNDSSWIEASGIIMGENGTFLYYMSKESNEETNQFHVAVGSFGIPESWKVPIKVPVSIVPSPSPNIGSGESNSVSQNPLSLPVILALVAGSVAFVLIVLAIITYLHVRKRGRATKVFGSHNQPQSADSLMQSGGSFMRNGPRVEGRNVDGLV